MIVACPNCSTKYNLPDDKVPAKGIKVKCSKCSHLFKVTPPPSTPEEEVEVLLDDSAAPEPEQDKSSDFDAAFEEAVSGVGDDGPDDSDKDPADDFDDDFPGFDDEEKAEEPEEDFDDFDDDIAGELGGGADAPQDDDEDDFGLGDEEEEEEEDESGPLNDPDSGLFASLDDDLDNDLDGGKGKKRKKKSGGKGGIGRILLTLILLLVLGLLGAVLTFHLGLWSLPESMQDSGIELPFELPIAVPFVKSSAQPAEMGEGEAPAMPEGDPLDRIKQIQPVDFRQYVINNEVEGRVFVVEGQALNNSDSAKEQIRVEVALFNVDGVEIAKQEKLCGNTLSLFQLQVDDRKTIEENLSSTRGTTLNNSYIKPGETTPFMFVFFGLEEKVEEYRISITDAQNPQN